jgi:hypothetical protein
LLYASLKYVVIFIDAYEVRPFLLLPHYILVYSGEFELW